MTQAAPTGQRRLLIIVENLPVPFDRRVWMEATSLQRAGWQVSVICPTGKGYEQTYEEIDGVHIYRHPLPAEVNSARGYLDEYRTALWHEWRLARKVRRERGFDVIHACNPPDLIFLVAAWFKLWYGTRFVFDHHDLCPELYESKFRRRGGFHRLLRLMERLTFRLADASIATNESYREVAVSRGRMAPSQVAVVRSGPELSSFTLSEPDPALKRGRRFLVGYLGVMGPQDGVDHLVRAAHLIINEHARDDVQFLFIGSGPMRDELIALSRQLGIADHCSFPGRLPDAEMITGLRSCDVCVGCDPLNPLNDKCTMNKILEYMALERAVVQYDLTEGRRSARDAAVYARPNDIPHLAEQILATLADPDRCRELGRRGRLRMVESLEWRHSRRRLLDFYDRLLPPTRSHRRSA